MTIDLNAIRDRADAATAGPWTAGVSHVWVDDDAPICSTLQKDNATFVAHARADIPALVAEVERLREALAEIRDDARSRLPCDALGDGANPERQVGRKLDRIARKAAMALDGGGE